MAITSMVAGQINDVQRTVGALRDVCAGIPGLAKALQDADAALDRAFVIAEYGDDEGA